MNAASLLDFFNFNQLDKGTKQSGGSSVASAAVMSSSSSSRAAASAAAATAAAAAARSTSLNGSVLDKVTVKEEPLSEEDLRALQKDRQKKDNHNMSKGEDQTLQILLPALCKYTRTVRCLQGIDSDHQGGLSE